MLQLEESAKEHLPAKLLSPPEKEKYLLQLSRRRREKKKSLQEAKTAIFQKLSTQKKTIETSSPEKSSPQKTPTQKPTTEERPLKTPPTGSHSPQKSSSAKKTNANQKVANQKFLLLAVSCGKLVLSTGIVSEQKPSSKGTSPFTRNGFRRVCLPFSGLLYIFSDHPAGDRAPTQKKESPTQEGRLPRTSPPGEEVSPEKQSSPAKRILTSTSLPSEDEPALVEPVPTAFINSNKEEKKTSAEEKTLKETTLGERRIQRSRSQRSRQRRR